MVFSSSANILLVKRCGNFTLLFFRCFERISQGAIGCSVLCYCVITPSCLSYAGMDLPGLKRYEARMNVSCSRRKHCDAVEARIHNDIIFDVKS